MSIELTLYRNEWNNHQEKEESWDEFLDEYSNTRELPYKNVEPPTNWITFLLNKRRSFNDFETIEPFRFIYGIYGRVQSSSLGAV